MGSLGYSETDTVDADAVPIKGHTERRGGQLGKSQSVEIPRTNREESEIIVKLRDPKSKALLRTMHAKELCKLINKTLLREMRKVGQFI